MNRSHSLPTDRGTAIIVQFTIATAISLSLFAVVLLATSGALAGQTDTNEELLVEYVQSDIQASLVEADTAVQRDKSSSETIHYFDADYSPPKFALNAAPPPQLTSDTYVVTISDSGDALAISSTQRQTEYEIEITADLETDLRSGSGAPLEELVIKYDPAEDQLYLTT